MRPSRGRTSRRFTPPPASDAPQYAHNRASSGFSFPQLLQYMPFPSTCYEFVILSEVAAATESKDLRFLFQ
jgi:hypothetical protein